MQFYWTQWIVISCTLTLVLFGILKPTWSQQYSVSINQQSPLGNRQRLEEEKLKQEILKFQLENKKLSNFWERYSSSATLLTTLIAVFSLIATIWKQISETSRQKELDRQQRELDRQQRADESLRRLEEKFTTILTNLGSNSLTLQAGAAVSLLTFLLMPGHIFRGDE